MKGHMAKCYGDLVQELWSGTQKNIAPLKLRVSYSGVENKDFFLSFLHFFLVLPVL